MIENFNPKIDSNRSNTPESFKVPMDQHPYNPTTMAEKKIDLAKGGKNVSNTVPPSGRGISGYGNSRSIGPGSTGNHRSVNNEGGRETSRTRAQGKVIKTTNHPNSRINNIYS